MNARKWKEQFTLSERKAMYPNNPTYWQSITASQLAETERDSQAEWERLAVYRLSKGDKKGAKQANELAQRADRRAGLLEKGLEEKITDSSNPALVALIVASAVAMLVYVTVAGR